MEKPLGEAAKREYATKLEKARLGFEVLAGQVALVSQEIYSRFNAMLTANSIIIAIIGLTLTGERQLPQPLPQLLPVLGLVLCTVWWLFNHHGVYWQTLFRQEALRLEKAYFSDTFGIWSFVFPASEDVKSTRTLPTSESGSISHPWLIRCFPYRRTSTIVIVVFGAIHAVLFIVAVLN